MPVPDPFREGMARGWKTRDGSQLDSDLTLEADVVIVGSGAGGGTTRYSDSNNAVTLTTTITAVNDAPVLAGANDLGAIDEDAVANTGTLVSALIAGQVSDADPGAVAGIAVVAVDDTNGAWEYTTDGNIWTAFGAVDPAAARLLGMSYRRAWQLVEETNRSLREPAVVTAKGGTHGGGAGLTATGKTVVRSYRALEDAARKAAATEIATLTGLMAP